MFKRLIALLVCFTFSFSNLQYVYAQPASPSGGDFSINQLPVPGAMIGESAPFAPLALKGLVVNLNKPLEFQFIVDTGKGPQDSASIKEEANKLVKYFLAGLTIPEGELWVNLSPYEKNRITTPSLGSTELGRDLLAQDYILKQLTASLIYPEKDLGKEFWGRVYAKAQQQFGTTNIPVNTFNKVWILPDQAQVFENGAAAYVTKSTLKVMLDEDYLAMQKHSDVRVAEGGASPASAGFGEHAGETRGQDPNINRLGSQIVRQIVLPEIEKEVNTGKNFAPLRQIYDAMILAKWYKETFVNGLLDAVYTNKKKTAGVNLTDPAVKEQIYQRYLQAYKKGVFNYIKEDPTPNGQSVPRKYFSGGLTWTMKLDRFGRQADVHGDGAMVALVVSLGVVGATGLAVAMKLRKDNIRKKVQEEQEHVAQRQRAEKERLKRQAEDELATLDQTPDELAARMEAIDKNFKSTSNAEERERLAKEYNQFSNILYKLGHPKGKFEYSYAPAMGYFNAGGIGSEWAYTEPSEYPMPDIIDPQQLERWVETKDAYWEKIDRTTQKVIARIDLAMLNPTARNKPDAAMNEEIGRMKPLTEVAGLPVWLNMDTGDLTLGSGIVSEPLWTRPLKDAGNSIAEPHLITKEPHKIIYYGYRNARLKEDTEKIDKLKLRFDITVLQPGFIGDEFIMTKGHEHPGTNYSEIYEVWSGTALYVQQGMNPDTHKFEMLATLARPGGKVPMLVGYSHRTINIGNTPLVMANWVSDEVGGKENKVPAAVKVDFSEIEKRNGYTYHVVRGADGKITFRHNPAYGNMPADLRFTVPAASLNENGLELSNNKPMYEILKDQVGAEAISEFLRDPRGFEPLFKNAFVGIPQGQFEFELSNVYKDDSAMLNQNLTRRGVLTSLGKALGLAGIAHVTGTNPIFAQTVNQTIPDSLEERVRVFIAASDFDSIVKMGKPAIPALFQIVTSWKFIDKNNVMTNDLNLLYERKQILDILFQLSFPEKMDTTTRGGITDFKPDDKLSLEQWGILQTLRDPLRSGMVLKHLGINNTSEITIDNLIPAFNKMLANHNLFNLIKDTRGTPYYPLLVQGDELDKYTEQLIDRFMKGSPLSVQEYRRLNKAIILRTFNGVFWKGGVLTNPGGYLGAGPTSRGEIYRPERFLYKDEMNELQGRVDLFRKLYSTEKQNPAMFTPTAQNKPDAAMLVPFTKAWYEERARKASGEKKGIESPVSVLTAVIEASILPGDPDKVKIALASGANVNEVQQGTGFTPLISASIIASKEVVDLLIAHGADLNAMADNGGSPLVMAIDKHRTEIVEVLIKGGADLNLKDNDGYSALRLASELGDRKIVEMLLEAGSNPNIVDKLGDSPLIVAAQKGHKEVVDLLIKKGADVNLKGQHDQTALMIAAYFGHKEIVRSLVANGADVDLENEQGNTALDFAKAQNNQDILAILKTIAHQKMSDKILAGLKGATGDINVVDKQGWTSLMIMSFHGFNEVVGFLIKRGANLNIQDSKGWTALMIAAAKGHKAVVNLLLQAGVKVNIQDKEGRTALSMARDKGYQDIVEILIKAGAKDNAMLGQRKQHSQDSAMSGLKKVIIAAVIGLGAVVSTSYIYNNFISPVSIVTSGNSSGNIVEGLAKNGLEDRGLSFNAVGLMPDVSPVGNGHFMKLYFQLKVSGRNHVPFSAVQMKGYSGNNLQVVSMSGFVRNEEKDSQLPPIVLKTQFFYPDSSGHIEVPEGISAIRADLKPGAKIGLELQFEYKMFDRVELIVIRPGEKDSVFIMKDVMEPFLEKEPGQNGDKPTYHLKITPPYDRAMLNPTAPEGKPDAAMLHVGDNAWVGNQQIKIVRIPSWVYHNDPVNTYIYVEYIDNPGVSVPIPAKNISKVPSSEFAKKLSSKTVMTAEEKSISNRLQAIKSKIEAGRYFDLVQLDHLYLDLEDQKFKMNYQNYINFHDQMVVLYRLKEGSHWLYRLERAKQLRDGAMATTHSSYGGIDLNQIAIKRTGKTIKMQFDPAQLNSLEQGGFEGFTPVIINMTRISSPFQLLGVNQPAKEPEVLAKV